MIKKAIKQLEWFGYIINKEGDYFSAEKDEVPLFIITKTITINFSFMYETNGNGYLKTGNFFKYLNDLNVSSLITTFTSRKKGYLEFSAHYNGIYDVKRFSDFIRAWEFDMDQMLNNVDTDFFFQRDGLGDCQEEYNQNNNHSFRAEA
jgi:hypothetical protein